MDIYNDLVKFYKYYTKSKIYHGRGPSFLTKKWIKYAEMTGFFEEIKQRYPKAFLGKS